MKDLQLVVCGLGGQGVMFFSRVLAEAAITEGREVLTAETHGMSQRGGSVDAYVKLGAFSGSTVRPGCADAAFVLHESRLESARSFLRPGGVCFLDSAQPVEGALTCDASRVASEAGAAMNLVLLGFALAAHPALGPKPASVAEALERFGSDETVERNRCAVARGAALASVT